MSKGKKISAVVFSVIGLAGIAEYNWITEVALPNPRNIPFFEAAGLKK